MDISAGPAGRSLLAFAITAFAAPLAHAQSFLFSYSDAYAAVAQPPSTTVDSDQASGPDFLSAFASAGASSAAVSLQQTRISNVAASHDAYYLAAGSINGADFQVSQDSLVSVRWNFLTAPSHGLSLDLGAGTGTDPIGVGPGSPGGLSPGALFADSFLRIDDLDGGGTLFASDLSNPSGSAQLLLLAGRRYSLAGATRADAGSNGASSFAITVPGPGPAALACVAGLVAGRRRRA